MSLIFGQVLFLFASSAGWGWWLYWLLFRDSPLSANRIALFTAAGMSLQVLLVGNLAYANLTVHQSFWLPVAIGIAGLLHAAKNHRIVAALNRRDRRELVWMAAVFGAAFAIQGISLFHTGPYDYYGVGTIDHVNYVLVAQALLDHPLSLNNPGAEPWLFKFVGAKIFRLGQSFLHAYVAAGTGGNAKESFGPLSVAFIALSGMFSYQAARLLSLGRAASAAAGIWAGVALAATRIHTFGFFSQSVTIFVLPALFVAVRAFGVTGWRAFVVPTLLLAHMFVSYTEFFPFAVLGFGACVAIGPRQTFLRRALPAAAAAIAALLLLPGYIPNAIGFYRLHASLLKPGVATKLDNFAPFGGTMYGWARDLVSIGALSPASERDIIAQCGFALLLMIAFAFYTRPSPKLLWLAALLLPFVTGLAALFLKSPVPKYQIWKVQVEYGWLCVLLIVLGFARLRQLLSARLTPAAGLAAVAVGGVVVASGIAGGILEQRKLVRLEDNFASVSSIQNAASIATFARLETNPPDGLILADRVGLLNAWLAYHARRVPAYSLGAPLSDMGPLQLPPPAGKTLPYATGAGISLDPDVAFPPAITIRNPQGIDRDPNSAQVWYWMAQTLSVQIDRLPRNTPPEPFEIGVTVTPGPANPAPHRRIAYVNTATGQRGEFTFNQRTVAALPVQLVAGSNTIQFTLVEPTTDLKQLPPDPRVLATRVEDIQIRRAR